MTKVIINDQGKWKVEEKSSGIKVSILTEPTEEYKEKSEELSRQSELIRVKREYEEDRQKKQKQAELKAVQTVITKMILKEELSENEIEEVIYLYPEWVESTEYELGQIVENEGSLYQIKEKHISENSIKPSSNKSKYKELFVRNKLVNN